jgi:hypothetical protein
VHWCRTTELFVLLSTIQTRVGLYNKCPIFFSAFNQICISRLIYLKVSSIKIHNSPSNGRWETCRQPDEQTDRHDEMNRRVSSHMRTRKVSREEENWRKYRHTPFLLTSLQDRTKPIISRTCPQDVHLNYSLIRTLLSETVLATWIYPKAMKNTVKKLWVWKDL